MDFLGLLAVILIVAVAVLFVWALVIVVRVGHRWLALNPARTALAQRKINSDL